MKRYIDLPADFETSEGLDGHWDDIDETTPESQIILDYFSGLTTVTREEALEATLGILGTKLDDAGLTSL